MHKITVLGLALLATIGSEAAPYSAPSSSGYSNFGSGSGGLSLSSYGGYGDSGSQSKQSYSMGASGGGQEYGGQPQVIEVSPDQLPVQVHFRTASSRLNVQQSHNPNMAPQVEHASFQDEPHRVVHEVVKPVIQEVREIIQPYRRVTQEIRPVIEEVHTVVHKGENRRGHGGNGGQMQKGYAQMSPAGGQSYKSKA